MELLGAPLEPELEAMGLHDARLYFTVGSVSQRINGNQIQIQILLNATPTIFLLVSTLYL